MARRVRASDGAGRAVKGKDLGRFRDPRKGQGKRPAIGFTAAPWSNGRTLALTGGEVQVRTLAGQPGCSGAGGC